MILESSCSLLPLWNLFLGKALFSPQICDRQMYQCSPTCFYLFLAVLGLRWFVWAFSSCGEQGLLFAVVHGCLNAVGSLAAERGLQGAWASVFAALRLSCCRMWDLPWAGTEPVSPTLGGRLLSSAPPGKSFLQEIFACTNFLLSSSHHLQPTSYSGFSYQLLLILSCTEVTHWRLQVPNSWLLTCNVPVLSPLLKWSRTLWPLPCMSSACLLCVKKTLAKE